MGQTYGDAEIIVCDDGSTDDSRAVLEKLVETTEGLRAIYQDNAGQAAALNAAFAASTGDVIVLLDADDYMRNDKLEKVIGALRENPDAGIAIHQMMRVDANGAERGTYPLAAELPAGWLGPRALAAAGYVPWIQAGIMNLRREVAERIFPLPPEVGRFSDVILRGVGVVLARVVTVAEPLAYYRLHGGNVGNAGRTFDRAEMLERRRRDLEEIETTYAALADTLRTRLGLSPQPFEGTRPYLERRYVIARLANEPRAVRSDLLARLLATGDQLSPKLRALYRLSPFMPTAAFKAGLEFAHGQGRLKGALDKRR